MDEHRRSGDTIERLKHEARERSRSTRRGLDATTCERASDALAARLTSLADLTDFAHAHTLLAYAALAEEIDPAPAVARLRERGLAVAFPRIEAPGVLGLHLVADASELEPARYGLREPRPDAPRVAFADVDLVLVPGVAFDERGFRLGYGGGYYDRLLPQLRNDCLRIGLAYDEQVVELLPTEEHDVEMDLVVTPTRTITVDSRAR
jgi:5-formyltetrahydrofolate cyclo-ligase